MVLVLRRPASSCSLVATLTTPPDPYDDASGHAAPDEQWDEQWEPCHLVVYEEAGLCLYNDMLAAATREPALRVSYAQIQSLSCRSDVVALRVGTLASTVRSMRFRVLAGPDTANELVQLLQGFKTHRSFTAASAIAQHPVVGSTAARADDAPSGGRSSAKDRSQRGTARSSGGRSARSRSSGQARAHVAPAERSFRTPSTRHGEARPTEKEASLRRLFGEFDEDGSGAIDAEEFFKAAAKLGIALPRDELLGLVKDADADGSGEIEFDEFVGLIGACEVRVREAAFKRGRTEQQLKELFGEFDEDGSCCSCAKEGLSALALSSLAGRRGARPTFHGTHASQGAAWRPSATLITRSSSSTGSAASPRTCMPARAAQTRPELLGCSTAS